MACFDANVSVLQQDICILPLNLLSIIIASRVFLSSRNKSKFLKLLRNYRVLKKLECWKAYFPGIAELKFVRQTMRVLEVSSPKMQFLFYQNIIQIGHEST